MKYLEPSFSTFAVGSEEYRDNHDRIFGKKDKEPEEVPAEVEQPTKPGVWALTPGLVRVVPVGPGAPFGTSYNPPAVFPTQKDMPLMDIPEEQQKKTVLLIGRVLVEVKRVHENLGTRPTLALVNPHDTKGTPFEKNGTEGVVDGVQIVTSMLCPVGQVMLSIRP